MVKHQLKQRCCSQLLCDLLGSALQVQQCGVVARAGMYYTPRREEQSCPLNALKYLQS